MNNIKILDGAIGSELILRDQKLPPYIWSADANLTNPDLLLDIHREYIETGANYITANTFRTTPRAYKKTGLSSNEASQIAQKSMQSAIKIAKNASNESIKVLGSIAPLEDCYSPQLFPGVDIAKKEFSIIIIDTTLFTNHRKSKGSIHIINSNHHLYILHGRILCLQKY